MENGAAGMGGEVGERSFLFARLEQWLGRIGLFPATAVLSGVAILAALGVHLILKTIEGESVSPSSLINIPVEGARVAAPLIFYSRHVIRQLARSRAQLQDMSERLVQAAEEAMEASKAKSAFLVNMSHELRTPLNAILGFSEIMKDQHLGPVSNARYLSYAADIHASGKHLLGIINDVLDLAKIESGKMTLDGAEEFALAAALAPTLTMLAGLGEKHGVAVVSAWSDGGPRLVAVERMVQQMVINLIGNAIKFTPNGGSVTMTGMARPDGGYRLSVRDTGIGMSESEIVTALTPFGQIHAAMTGRRDGTGLGLPLAKAMIELHGGRLAVESRINHDTCVTLEFPPERMAPGRHQQAA